MKVKRFRIIIGNTEVIIHEIRRRNVFVSVLYENDIEFKEVEEEYES